MMRGTIIIGLLALFLASCTISPEAGLQLAKGRHVDYLTDKLGLPDGELTVAGQVVYVWSSEEVHTTTTVSTPQYASPYHPRLPGPVIPGATRFSTSATASTTTSREYCVVKVAVDDNYIVVHTEWEGTPWQCDRYAQRLQ